MSLLFRRLKHTLSSYFHTWLVTSIGWSTLCLWWGHSWCVCSISVLDQVWHWGICVPQWLGPLFAVCWWVFLLLWGWQGDLLGFSLFIWSGPWCQIFRGWSCIGCVLDQVSTPPSLSIISLTLLLVISRFLPCARSRVSSTNATVSLPLFLSQISIRSAL